MLNTPSASRISLASLALITLALSACQTTPAPTHAVKVTVTRGFNDYAPVPGRITKPRVTQYSPVQASALQTETLPADSVGVQGIAPSSAQTALSGVAGGAIESLRVQENFDYSSTQDVALTLSVFNPNQKAYSGVPIAVFDSENQEPLIKGITNANGRFENALRLPAHVKSVNVQVSAIGINNSASIPIQSGRVIANFGNAPTN